VLCPGRAAIAAVAVGAVLAAAGSAAGAASIAYSSGNLSTAIPDNASLENTIAVPDAGEIVDVKVAVNIAHTQDDQLNIDLVGPDGALVRLSHDQGGSGNNYGTGTDCSGGFTEFSDGATTSINAGVAPFVGSFRPEQALAAFAGRPSNGPWKLVVRDDGAGVVGTLWCWKLTMTFAQADLGLAVTDSPDPVVVGSELVYTNVVTNVGPDSSKNTTLTSTLPAGVSFDLVQTTQGTCNGVATIVCTLGSLTSGASATVTIAVTPSAAGQLSYSANVTGTPDPPGLTPNNAVTVSTTVTAGLPDLRDCSITGTSGDDVLAGTDGDDVICGFGGNDRIIAGAGDDVVYGDAGDDVVYGDAGDDVLHGGEGDDRLSGGTGRDAEYGGVGADRVRGDEGADYLKGGGGRDILVGAEGNDVLLARGDGARDILRGGAGRDQGLMDRRRDVRFSVEKLLERAPPKP
jgi:uncharacterized repeat protein (TIGR01451 family)